MEDFKIIDTLVDMSGRRRQLVAGVGINDANYTVNPIVNGKRLPCLAWRAWNAMVSRCYDSTYQSLNPSYSGCIVSEDWLLFSNFKRWWDSEPDVRKGRGWALDKDLLSDTGRGKLYSKDTCVLLPHTINMIFHKPEKSKQGLPRGVGKDKNTEKYKARIKMYGKLKHIGSYMTIEEARASYLKIKSEYIIELAEKYKEEISTIAYQKLYKVSEDCLNGRNY